MQSFEAKAPSATDSELTERNINHPQQEGKLATQRLGRGHLEIGL